MVAHVAGDPVTDSPPKSKTQPVLFLSKMLSPAETRYWPTELEVACLVWTMKRIRWMAEACDKPVVALTDHAGTTSTATQTSLASSSADKLNNRLLAPPNISPSSAISGWSTSQVANTSSLTPFRDSQRPGATAGNVLEDVVDVCTSTHVVMNNGIMAQLLAAYQTDKHMSRVQSLLQSSPDSTSFQQDGNGLFYLDDRLCILQALEGDIFQAAHDAQYHVGFHRLYLKVASQYFIRKLASWLRKYLRHCLDCQVLDTKRHKPYGASHPITSPP
ncbi:hypothetical protein KC356_g8025 [Hortaea werneckii]|nr:hypothetical protein KC356_g8025 [Hortaea werneckii]